MEVVADAPWPDLVPDLLALIFALVDPMDRVAVRLVCASWRACVREYFPSDPPFEPPRLLFRRPGHRGELAFFSLLHRRKILPFALPAHLRAGRCCGHVAGWLAMAFDSDRTVVLCNPVADRSVAVPRPPVFPVKKMIFSGPPTAPDWVAAVLGTTGTVALLQPAVSAAAWMTMGIEEGWKHGGFRDIALWRGRLCALGHDGAVLAFRGDLRARAAAVSQLRDAEVRVGRRFKNAQWDMYLLVMGMGPAEEELLLVTKMYKSLPNKMVDWDVDVWQLASPETRTWDFLTKIPGQALFVGSVVSVAVPVAMPLCPSDEDMHDSSVYFARRDVEYMWPHAICEYPLMHGDIFEVPVAGGHNADVDPVWITAPVV